MYIKLKLKLDTITNKYNCGVRKCCQVSEHQNVAIGHVKCRWPHMSTSLH